ncbi:hypothetical protein BG844_05150 [Couchioplanes caeruleus subsp. caeruleus]|uniref:Novel STAND NTPase 1 domain-containing protein n=1 Tax=Couchioplanes caeruleus subsp. caeruleus TaxID=56427 RepID=A0A1K0GVC9_9ACTN|nr:hypothetical protein BG844_05150 [Couchioplanes caeruleus subsp. caeruleus]
MAIHAGPDDCHPLGTGVVIDRNQVLTCAHVLRRDGEVLGEIWIAFPKAPGVGYGERRVAVLAHTGEDVKNVDVALLELAEPVPPSVRPARLRCAPPAELSGRSWWAFGFPDGAEHGGSAEGVVGDPLTYGRIHLASESAPGLRTGFSGGALWSEEYDAVVGLVVAAGDGDGYALTLHHADEQLPELKLSMLAQWQAGDADDAALAAWGWALENDEEARRHWLPRARGVAVHTERGSRFRGRTAALRTIVSWLDAPEAHDRPLVVTGSPGVGKSAVLGRIVTTADPGARAALPTDDTAEAATPGSVSCAVHAKGKTALEIAAEIARAAAVGLPADPADLMPALRERLTRRPARFNLVVDALDEAVSPAQARRLVRDVVLPLTRHLAPLGVQVVVGTRRADDHGDLLAEFGPAAEVVDLDAAQYFSESDLAGYALATLAGAERPGNPYADERLAEPVARRIAVLSQGNFLVAGLVARARGLRDARPAHPDEVTFSATVADALDRYVDGLPAAGGAPARLALTALAHAETPGLPISLWQVAAAALGGRATEEELTFFARTSAANFLVESGTAEAPTYRLFHQALNEALLADGKEREESRIVAAWLRYARTAGWAAAPEYLLRALPRHAARTGLVDDLLADDGYVLHAHLDRLLPAADAARTELGAARAQLLQRTPQALRAPALERAALFSVVEKIDALPGGLRPVPGAPYAARWARTPRRLERTVLEGHSEAVYDVAALAVDGRSMLASAADDGTVRLWDPLTSQTEHVIDCHDDCVRGLAAVRVGDVHLLATASHDRTIKLWDPRGCRLVRTLTGHRDWVRNLCTVVLPDGHELLVSGSDDRTVRLWDPATGDLIRTLEGHTGWVTAVCRAGRFVASAGFDGTVRLWDPATGAQIATFAGHTGWVTTLYPVRDMVASAGYDGTVRFWDARWTEAVAVFDTQAGPLTDLCTLEADDALLLAATDEDGTIRLWDMHTGRSRQPIEGYASWIRAICELPVGDRNLLATAGDDGTVRLWDPATGRAETVMDGGRLGAVGALAAIPAADGTLVASTGGDGTVRLWEPSTGEERLALVAYGTTVTDVTAVADDERRLIAVSSEDRAVRIWDVDHGQLYRELKGHHERVNAVRGVGALLASGADDLIVRVWDLHRDVVRPLLGHATWVTALAAAHDLLVSADKNGMLRLWDPAGELLTERQGHHDAVNALACFPLAGREILVSAGADRTVRLWDLTGLTPRGVLTGHTAAVTGVCPMRFAGRAALASASLDRTVRIWDAGTGRLLRIIPVHHRALACAYVGDVLIVGLDRGLLALGTQ